MNYFRVNGDYIEKYNVTFDEEKMEEFDKKYEITLYIERRELGNCPMPSLERSLKYMAHRIKNGSSDKLYNFLNYYIPSDEELAAKKKECEVLEEKREQLVKQGVSEDNREYQIVDRNIESVRDKIWWMENRRECLPFYNELLNLLKAELVEKYPYKHLVELAELFDVEFEEQISFEHKKYFECTDDVMEHWENRVKISTKDEERFKMLLK